MEFYRKLVIKSGGGCVRFKWNNLDLPKFLDIIPHNNDSTHAYLEVESSGKWRKVDATWDKPLQKILPINEWNLGVDARTAVPELEVFSPERSTLIIVDETKDDTEADLKINGKFYSAFNTWLEQVRNT